MQRHASNSDPLCNHAKMMLQRKKIKKSLLLLRCIADVAEMPQYARACNATNCITRARKIA